MKKIIASILAVLTLTCSVVANAQFYERTSAPSTDNPHFYNTGNNPFYTSNLWSWCTWYSFGRAREILGKDPQLSHGAASDWFNYNKSKGLHPYSTEYNKAKKGAVMCFTNRVAVVESVNDDGTPKYISGSGTNTYKTSEFNVGQWKASRPFYFGEVWGRDTFVGYIYLIDDAQAYTPPQQQQQQQKPQPTTPPSPFKQKGVVMVNDGYYLYMRKEPNSSKDNMSIVCSLPKGAIVAIDPSKSENGWYYIKYNDKEGYASGKYIKVVD